ncbi:2-hydroxychromene-2-carboxylate isomerase [Sinimarinibacterium sp. CAU 1509]|uniref:DsbA family protein n=1 Tax=Sinimarinibacterium sp. CAU 1509 TaxID=2562283 RepID=UPI0010ACD072|nr:DsbA family protein [Sinimarinibacterium sp. CAU 1509]TJY62267.1 2-hydroxychromene-2-carboxylate isomerase [Sinimarinibacterium sp. CAU 1509]
MPDPMPEMKTLPRAGLRPSLQSRVAERIASSRDPIARLRAGKTLELYYEVGDAHSQLCASMARTLLPRLQVPLQIRLVPAPDVSAYPEQDKQRAFASLDARRIAPCHGLPAPVAVPPTRHDAVAAHLAAAGSNAEAFLQAELDAMTAIASNAGLTGPALHRDSLAALLKANAERRRKLGHYLPAMWQYHGEWFWALDRLDILYTRLIAAGALRNAAPLSPLDPQQLPEPPAPIGTPLEFWFSFRSPYSYLAAVELLRRRARGQLQTLQVRPVLPMVMRGLPVPRNKRLYIVRDVKRCADVQQIPFGRIHDPVGDGVLRLLTVFPYTADADTQLRYCAIAGQSVWAEGLDARRDDVLRSVIERSGLDWTAAQQTLAQGIDTTRAEANREALFAAGLWGVPSFRLGDFTTWGQDRLWMVDRLTQSV